jgi:hypothetical protein
MTQMHTASTVGPGEPLSSALLGEEHAPFMRTNRVVPGFEVLLEQYTRWIVLPARVAPPMSTLPSLTRRCRSLTGWSTRDLADVLRTSHTTVRMFEATGRVTVRSRDAAARVRPLLGVLSRLARVAGIQERLALALATPLDTGEKPIDLLNRQEWARAFTAGLDVLRSPRPEMLVPLDGWDAHPGTREMR